MPTTVEAPTLIERLAQLAVNAVDAEALAREALLFLVAALGADAGEITLAPSGGISPRLARVGDPPRINAPSKLAAPLHARGVVVGELAIWATRAAAFDDHTRRALASAAAVLGPSVEMLRADAARDIGRQAVELSALHRLADSVARSLDLDEVLGSSLDLALDVMHAASGVIILRDDERSVYRAVIARTSYPASDFAEIPCAVMDSYFARLEYLERTPAQLAQLGFAGAPWLERLVAAGIARLISLPLRREDRIVGILSLALRPTDRFEPTTLHTLRAITRHLAVFIENARAHHSVALRERVASLLRDFGEKVVSPIEPAELYRLVLRTVQAIMRCNGALISRIDLDAGRARVIAASGRDEPLIGVELPTTTPFIHDAMATSKPLVIEDTSTIGEDNPIGRVARERKTKSFVLLTMRHRGQPIGHLFTGSDEPRRWAREELEAMELLGTMTAEVLERERLSAVAEAERRMLDATIEDLPIVISVVDENGRRLHANRAARAVKAIYSRGGTADWRAEAQKMELRRPDGTAIPHEERPLARAFRGEVVLPTEVMLTTPDGVAANVLAFAVPISRDSTGRVLAVAVGYQDVSALRALADEKDRFLRVASHELRSPLTSLRATTSLLELDPTAVSDPDRRATMLQRIRRQIDRLVKLVEQLIDSARVRAELPLDPKRCDLVELTREAIDLAITANGDPTRKVALTGAPSLSGCWDPLRIEQVVTNLVSNALRYSPDASTVEVCVEAVPEADRVRITVVDHGIGIPRDQIENIFGPFFRANNAVAAHRGGLGLGLYIASEVVRRHGGTISVESEPNVRTAFVIDLPREVH
jgi:signal transduction histidine kinase/GAF domain-containing protein